MDAILFLGVIFLWAGSYALCKRVEALEEEIRRIRPFVIGNPLDEKDSGIQVIFGIPHRSEDKP